MLSAFISFFPSLFWLTCSIVFLLEPQWWTLPVNHGIELVSSLQIHFPAFCCLQLAHQTWHSSEILSALELFRRDVYRMFKIVPGQSVSPLSQDVGLSNLCQSRVASEHFLTATHLYCNIVTRCGQFQTLSREGAVTPSTAVTWPTACISVSWPVASKCSCAIYGI